MYPVMEGRIARQVEKTKAAARGGGVFMKRPFAACRACTPQREMPAGPGALRGSAQKTRVRHERGF